MKLASLLLAVPLLAQDVVPVFQKHCAGCHAGAAKMGGFSLESPEAMTKVVVPGKSGESRLFLMLTGAVKPRMPMGAEPLPAGDIETVKQWIDSGAALPSMAARSAKPVIPDIKPLTAVKPQSFSVAYSPDGKLIAIGGFKEVRLIDAATRKLVGTLSGHAETVRAVAFSSDGKRLAAAGGGPGRKGEVRTWDVENRTPLKTIPGHSDAIYATAFSPDGKLIATSSYDKLVKLWDAETGAEVRTLKDHIDAVYTLAFTPDGKRLASGAADRTIKIWNIATGQRLYTLGEPADGINTLAIDPTGKLIAAAGLDKSIRVWALEPKSGRLLNTQIAHEDAILKLAWSPDGSTLVSSSSDRTIKVFRATDLTELRTIAQQPDWVYGLAFSPDGKSFVAVRYDGSLTVYDTQEHRTASR
jgi:WD40 repeat protein